MKNYVISGNAQGQRLDRYLMKLFPGASRNQLQKSIRKKNILLNQHKTNPEEFLTNGDIVTVYFSDETINKFKNGSKRTDKNIPASLISVFKYPIYEDANLIAINKPAGFLTQPDASGKISISDCIAAFLPSEGTFHPAPANRLDFNTSGIILIPKSYDMQKKISRAIRERKIIKDYAALVAGNMNTSQKLIHHLKKDCPNNHVYISNDNEDILAKLFVRPLCSCNNTTLVSVTLETGRTHQIRVQLAANGHPIAGDSKYGNDKVNLFFRKIFNLNHQLLHSRHYAIPDLGLDFTAPLPNDFSDILLSLGYSNDILC